MSAVGSSAVVFDMDEKGQREDLSARDWVSTTATAFFGHQPTDNDYRWERRSTR